MKTIWKNILEYGNVKYNIIYHDVQKKKNHVILLFASRIA